LGRFPEFCGQTFWQIQGIEVVTLTEKRARLMEQLAGMKNSQERFAYIVRRGREYPGLSPDEKTDATRIEGCLAKAWFIAAFVNGRCRFRADSESAIVKGIAAILCDLHDDCTPEEVLSADASFLEKAGIDQHLTPNRRNSLVRIWEKLHSFARENQTQRQS
jgi:cysteine desulfuration protein SufE